MIQAGRGGTESAWTVVLDTSVFVSAILFRGLTSRLVPLWQMGRITVLMSAEVLKEYARVLAYPKFKLNPKEIRAIIEKELLPYVNPVRVRKVPPVIAEDPSDNKFLALAAEGKAADLISGDAHLLGLKSYAGVRILTPADFLSHLP